MFKKIGFRFVQLSAMVYSIVFFSSCLYSTQHFNNGRLLEPGHSHISLGGGASHFPSSGCPDNWYEAGNENGAGRQCKTSTFDPVSGSVNFSGDSIPLQKYWNSLPKIGLDYRLGISRQWGFFTGTEIGLHIEGPTNPISGEFDLKLGLPGLKKHSIRHSLSAGWIIGAWADNSYFTEYAISRIWGENSLFGNYRFTYLATQPADLMDANDLEYFHHKRRQIHQASIGFTWTLPQVRILPDFIVPQAILTYPLGPLGQENIPEIFLDDRAIDFNLGLGWNFK